MVQVAAPAYFVLREEVRRSLCLTRSYVSGSVSGVGTVETLREKKRESQSGFGNKKGFKAEGAVLV